jgi:hypothetical protein
MPCALCLQEVELRRSHIIPKFLYETLYDDKHRLQVLSIKKGGRILFQENVSGPCSSSALTPNY